jgi:sulfite reductase alpha subunit-like flavoprotein
LTVPYFILFYLKKYIFQFLCRLSQVIELLPLLQPRRYSITTAPSISPSILSFAFTVVEMPLPIVDKTFHGLCSNWLVEKFRDFERNGASGYRVLLPVQLHPSFAFRLPTDEKIPLVMMGFGTGMLLFVRNFHFLKQSAKTCWNFF